MLRLLVSAFLVTSGCGASKSKRDDVADTPAPTGSCMYRSMITGDALQHDRRPDELKKSFGLLCREPVTERECDEVFGAERPSSWAAAACDEETAVARCAYTSGVRMSFYKNRDSEIQEGGLEGQIAAFEDACSVNGGAYERLRSPGAPS